MTTSPQPVSVIIVNWNGRHHLEACLESIEASSYPRERLEIVLVDNGSTDGSVELVGSRFPAVRLVALPDNRGFTGGNNAGVGAATGDVLVFINNDMRVEPDAIGRLVLALDGGLACAAARVLDWAGRRIDFQRGTVSFEARGFQEHFGERPRPELDYDRATFFPNGGAFAVTRAAYERAGGFDDRFFAYYDDLDLGWRLRIAGFSIRVVPEAVVYHRHGATSRRYPEPQKRFLMDRNAIWTALKNYEDGTLARVLGPMLLLAARRVAQQTTVAQGAPVARRLAPFAPRCRGTRFSPGPRRLEDVYDLRESAASRAGPGVAREPAGGAVRRLPVESIAAVGAALDALPGVRADRLHVQQARVTDEAALLEVLGRPLQALASGGAYVAAQQALVEALELDRIFRPRTRAIFVVDRAITGTDGALRTLEVARMLAAHAQITLAVPGEGPSSDDGVTVIRYQGAAALQRILGYFTLVAVSPGVFRRYACFSGLHVPLVANLLDDHPSDLAGADGLLRQADLVLCGEEELQRLVSRALEGLGRPRPPGDITAEHPLVIEVAPGLSATAPASTRLSEYFRVPALAPDRARRIAEARARLERSYRVSRWLRATALRAGVSEARIEHIKQWSLVQRVMILRNRIALWRAGRATRR